MQATRSANFGNESEMSCQAKSCHPPSQSPSSPCHPALPSHSLKLAISLAFSDLCVLIQSCRGGMRNAERFLRDFLLEDFDF